MGIFTLLKNGVPTLIRSPVNHSGGENREKRLPDENSRRRTPTKSNY